MNKLLFTWVEFLYSPGFLWPWHEWTWLTCLNSKSVGRAFTAKEDIMAPLQQRSKWWEDAHFDEVFFRLGWNHQLVSLCVCVSFKESIRRQQDRRAELLLKRQEERMQAEIMDCTFRLLTNYQASGVILVGSPEADWPHGHTWALDEWF